MRRRNYYSGADAAARRAFLISSAARLTLVEMAYHFKAKESVPEGIRRIVREETESAVGELTNHTADHRKRDEAIHEARKSIKKIRGALRLVQPELGQMYSKENGRLGETGRRLSELRDAGAIMEVFDGLINKYRHQLRPEAARAVRRGLLKNKQETERRLKVDGVVHQAVAALKTIGKDVEKWPLHTEGFEAIAPGFKNRYRRGKRAMAIAHNDPTPENFHEWRKRVKDHWYHVKLLESAWTEVLQAREAALDDLQNWLGDDHNLIVLGEKLDADPDQYGGEENVRLFAAVMQEYGNELREKSFALGAKIYEQKPKLFVRDMSNLWDAWHNEKARKPPGTQAAAASRNPRRAVA
jgi:CHAD domain-containing protein